MGDLLIVYYYLKRNWSKVVILSLIWLMFTLMFVADTYGKDFYASRSLLHIWEFENKNHFEIDTQANAIAFVQGKVKWVPEEHSFSDSAVIHIHGDKDAASFFMVPSTYTNHPFTNWTLDFEFAIGTHAIDPEDHDLDQGRIMDGVVVEWGDLKVIYFDQDDGWRGKIVAEYRQRVINIPDVSAFDWHHMVVRSEEYGVSIWMNAACIKYIRTPRTSMKSEKIKFASNGFSGRLDRIKLYNTKLRPWEITQNFWGTELSVDKNYKLTTTWGEMKR